MEKTAEDKKYATDNRKFKDAVLTDNIHKIFTDSPITSKLLISDLCFRGNGFLGAHGKETKTSWDTLSYTLLQSHNVWMHINAVQEANRCYEKGILPKMLLNEKFDRILFKDIIDEIFKQKTKQKSLEIIENHSKLWMQMQSGSQGISGKKTVNAMTMFDKLFTFDTSNNEVEQDNDLLDSDDMINEVLGDNNVL